MQEEVVESCNAYEDKNALSHLPGVDALHEVMTGGDGGEEGNQHGQTPGPGEFFEVAEFVVEHEAQGAACDEHDLKKSDDLALGPGMCVGVGGGRNPTEIK